MDTKTQTKARGGGEGNQECRLRKSELERSWLQQQGRAAPGPLQTPSRQRGQGGLAASGGCMLFKNFLQQLYKRNPDSRL